MSRARGGRPLGDVSARVLAALETPRTMRDLAAVCNGTVPQVATALRNLQRAQRVTVAGTSPAAGRGPVRLYALVDEQAERTCSITVFRF